MEEGAEISRMTQRRTTERERHHQSEVGQEKSTLELITILNDSKGGTDSWKIRQLDEGKRQVTNGQVREGLQSEFIFLNSSFERVTHSLH